MLFFDIETDGLLEDLTKIHCMCIKDTSTDTMYRYTPENIEDGIRKLMAGETICGHNVIAFDLPAIKKLYPWFTIQKDKVVDTLVYARLVFSEVNYIDNKLTRIGVLPKRLYGSHSLKAYGYRLGVLKGTYCETEDAWAIFTPEMLDYNEQDVVVTEALYNKCRKKTTTEQALSLEHKAQWLMQKMENNGFTFDKEKALELMSTLQSKQTEVIQQLSDMVPRIPDKVFIPKRDNAKMGYKAGVPIQRYKEFNPNSRQQVLWIMKDYYKYPFSNPDMHNEDGKIQLNEDTFKLIAKDTEAPEEVRKLAELFQTNFLLTKRLGQLIDGKNGWLKLVSEDGKIHGHVNPNGAITGRATHSKPNIAQVPHVGTEYGKECRELFTVPKGWYQAGIDACGLELRCLSHYMYPFDNGEYANECVNGDIHTKNQIAAGLPERNMAKTFIYGFLYGAGDAKIGQIVGGTAEHGAELRKKFLKETPAIKKLQSYVKNLLSEYDVGLRQRKWKTRYLKGLDGRLLYTRSIHSALNLLLQSAGAIVCKYWIVRTEERLLNLGLDHGKDFQLMAWVHDEQQIACRTEEIAKVVVREAQEAMRDTQKYYNFKCQLDTEGIIGHNWYDCH
jgi:DNA polymerase I-like protein with 3'-5' exonuclease and polymerase domains